MEQLPEVWLHHPTAMDLAWLAARMREDEKAQWCALTGRDEYDPDLAARNFIAMPGLTFCLYDRQTMPIAAGGFIEVRPKVWQTWMVGTDEGWAQYWRAITKYARSLGDGLFRDGLAVRIETVALASRERAHRWYAKGMRQHFEGRHACWFPNGEDAVTYARTRKHWEADHGLES